MSDRICYYIMEDQRTEDGFYIPSLIQENVSGHSPVNGGPGGMPYKWGRTIEEARFTCSLANERMGLSDDDVMEIVGSSMRAQNNLYNAVMDVVGSEERLFDQVIDIVGEEGA